jgi:hypothetical protein
MPKSYPIQKAFNAGIFSPLLEGQIDIPRRSNAYSDSCNLLALKQGPLVRRGGTKVVFESFRADVDSRTKLIPFQFNDEQAYVLEFFAGFIRVIKDGGAVLKSSDSVTVTGITAASPPVVTVGAMPAGYVAGNWIVISGLSEAIELNDVWFRIKNVTGTTLELYDPDFTTPAAAPAVAETSSTGTMENTYFLTSPYSESDLFASDGQFRPDYVQSNDVMYIAHPDYNTRVLTRTADDAWTISDLQFNNGPWLPINETGITLAFTNVSPRVWDIVASAAIFDPDDSTGGSGTGDIDRLIRVNEGTVDSQEYLVDEQPKTQIWKWARITSYTNTTTVRITVDSDQEDFVTARVTGAGNPINAADWQLGAFSTTTGFPSYVTIHSGRLVLASTSSNPRDVYFSSIGGFNPTTADFTPDSGGKRRKAASLTIRPDDGFNVTIGGGRSDPIRWIESSQQGLAVGTIADEGIIRSSNNNESLDPENASYNQSTTIGSAAIKPLIVNGAQLFVNFSKRRLHEMTYSFENDRLMAPDMTELAEHLTRDQIIEIVHQQQPINTIWCLTAAGKLLGFTYERNADVLGWHVHEMGGTNVTIESICVVPSEDLSRDELYLAVQRDISGKAVGEKQRTYIERMERYYEDDIARNDIYHMDCGQTYSATEVSVEGATVADPVVITATAHPYSDGDNVYIKDVAGMTQLNGKYFKVKNSTANTFELGHYPTNNDVDGSMYSVYNSGGTIQAASSVFRALNHLEGETLEIYADGRELQRTAVSGGSITLPNSLVSANLAVGLPFDWHFESLSFLAESSNGTSLGKKQKISLLVAKLRNTLGFKAGPDSANLDEEEFDNLSQVNSVTTLFSGFKILNGKWDYDDESKVYLKGEGPFPVEIQALMPQITVSDDVH